jgi:hypothetical protein
MGGTPGGAGLYGRYEQRSSRVIPAIGILPSLEECLDRSDVTG